MVQKIHNCYKRCFRSLFVIYDSCAYIGSINENKMRHSLDKYMEDSSYSYNEVRNVIDRLGGSLFLHRNI